MKRVLWAILLMISYFSYAQQKEVVLIEKKQKKRTVLYVQNNTNTSKSVFLKVNPTGYRRSAQRPIIKKIPPNDTVQMLILIPLSDVESKYTYDLIVNDELETIDVNHNKASRKRDSVF
ncbi:hypothetical protein [Aquimarina algicola]|uniref:Molecular chaperone n=1 Tax=Aquimarina algicola TaxID=2589995 RepID=A0A504JE97_9FLAO|nr:hypothetical protein [Aquimarina algicola]TPN84711.1 hypothetical protein FHK87_17440 [Aquimarina algicola]